MDIKKRLQRIRLKTYLITNNIKSFDQPPPFGPYHTLVYIDELYHIRHIGTGNLSAGIYDFKMEEYNKTWVMYGVNT